ncbi:hypothetical protein V1264_009431 [Littorina saxatilis]|uniref:MICOS complex subunit n=1 Tax=Littorina saxatilis TaxID=31220 RepID=A0AAN9ASA9_9CAEN
MAVRRASQLLRIGVGSAALVSIPAMSYNFKVHAAEQISDGANMVNITKLPVYDNPEDKAEYRFEPEKISPFREVISEGRRAVWEYLETIKETTDTIKEKFAIGKAHTEGFIDFLQNDPGALPRAAVITVAGLGGIVAGYKGGVMRKMFFSASAIAAATSLCYPNEAVAMTTEAYNVALVSVKTLWEGDGTSGEKKSVVQDSSPTTADNQNMTVKGKNGLKGDPGQSKDEDKDMYTTRTRS